MELSERYVSDGSLARVRPRIEADFGELNLENIRLLEAALELPGPDSVIPDTERGSRGFIAQAKERIAASG